MATFEKRGQYWRAKVRRRGFPEQSRSFDTRFKAEVWARSVEAEMDRGIYVDRTEAEKNLLGDLIDRYLREVTPKKRGAGPERARLLAMRERTISRIKMAALSSAHIASYRDDRLKEVAAGTVIKELNHLSHIIETGRSEWGIQIAENPVSVVARPAQPKARDRRFRKGEEARLRKACEDARNPFLVPVIDLALETAMRQGEVVGLEWMHVDLASQVAHLPLTKNGEARSVPLSKKAVDVLKALRPDDEDAEGPVFPGLTGEAIKRAFMRACVRAELKDFHFHDLRHEATSRLFEKGLNPIEVASITGHKTLQMLKRYTHLNASDLARKLG
jgi:integrase